MKRTVLAVLSLALALALFALPAMAEEMTRLSVVTGGTGGVYYPLGGAVANVLSKHLPGIAATAEVTSASIDNLKLIGAGKADIAFTMSDSAWEGYNGAGKFPGKVPLRAIVVLYANKTQVVTVQGRGIEKMSDLKGKRISTGAPGSGTELIALRLLEAYGLNPEKDVKREKLSVAESVGAIKDNKIDAFIWSGGLPTAAVVDLGATPGQKIKLLDHSDAIPAMVKKYGPMYIKDRIPAKTYPGQDKDVSILSVWNILAVNEKMDDKLAYRITKTIFEKKPELVAVHKEAQHISLESQLQGGSPIPFHPGALKYFAEKGVKKH
ncbi:MAG: TAXI family TRAP transporter solute-binding subunit [Deltaproteobacteria bacterium]|nr:MAG: TAXI family TRAP transporter solute-binding subunit [Deltaproteobacteria bacterium]